MKELILAEAKWRSKGFVVPAYRAEGNRAEGTLVGLTFFSVMVWLSMM